MANELDVDAVEYAFAETDFPDSDLELWKRYPSDKGLGLGVINIKKLVVETEDEILAGVRKALEYVEPERIHLTTDCGQFSIPRPMAKGKLEAMTAPRARCARRSAADGCAGSSTSPSRCRPGSPPTRPAWSPRSPTSTTAPRSARCSRSSRA